MQLPSDDTRSKISNCIFYITLTAELFFMAVEKSAGELPFISHIFRVTFGMALLAVLIMKHDLREWVVVGAVLIFTFVCYRISGKNELLRFSVFMMAARDIDLNKTMKYIFYFSSVSFLIIAFLAIFGIRGEIFAVADFGRGGLEQRLALGFGHPNTLCGCIYALLLMWLWLYGKKAHIISYIFLLLLSLGVYALTTSRTTLIVFVVTICAAMLVRFFPKLKEKKAVYILSGLVSPLLCVAFSVFAAKISRLYWEVDHETHWVYRLDRLLNGRIANLYYNTTVHAGAIESWTLFSTRSSEEKFDMGWIRLYYWYGIIPACIVVLLVVLLIYLCGRRKDLWTVVLIFSLCIYTVIEATFVSRYIGRNFMLPIAAVYFGRAVKRRAADG